MSLLNLKNMFNPYEDLLDSSRGGVRGGHDQFSWEQVKIDKDRENYLAPVGRSQGGPDFLWYTKNKEKQVKVSQNKEDKEKQKIIELERQAMEKALGSSLSYTSQTLQAQSASDPVTIETKKGRKNDDSKKSKSSDQDRKTTKHDNHFKRRHHSPSTNFKKKKYDEPKKYRVVRKNKEYVKSNVTSREYTRRKDRSKRRHSPVRH